MMKHNGLEFMNMIINPWLSEPFHNFIQIVYLHYRRFPSDLQFNHA